MAKISFSEKLKNLLGGKKNFSEDFFEDLTDALIEGDLGAKNAVEIVDNLESFCKKEKKFSPEEITVELKNILMKFLKPVSIEPSNGKVNIFMVLGVNGVGKTTTVAKMAKLYSEKNVNVIMAAADTFRAAAVDQLSMHGEKLKLRVVKHQMGSDPESFSKIPDYLLFAAADYHNRWQAAVTSALWNSVKCFHSSDCLLFPYTARKQNSIPPLQPAHRTVQLTVKHPFW